MAARIRSLRFHPPDEPELHDGVFGSGGVQYHMPSRWRRVEIDADVDEDTAAALMQIFKDAERPQRETHPALPVGVIEGEFEEP